MTVTKFLLTGDPGCGKTTLIRRILENIRSEADGFYTEEIRVDGDRQGFKMITLDGQVGILAHAALSGPPRISKYGIDIASLDEIGVTSIQRAVMTRSLVVIDEIGPMEMFSDAFCQTVLEVLDSDLVVLGTIVKRSKPFSDQIKARTDVKVIEVYPNNRDILISHLLTLLSATGRVLTS